MNAGLTEQEINALENSLGLKLPDEYRTMLSYINGFDIEQIHIDPEGENDDRYNRECYRYPDDINNTQWLIEEINENLFYAMEALSDEGFSTDSIEGYVPLYAHRALVVMKDKSLSPVISVCGKDVIVYGKDLQSYWRNELLRS